VAFFITELSGRFEGIVRRFSLDVFGSCIRPLLSRRAENLILDCCFDANDGGRILDVLWVFGIFDCFVWIDVVDFE